MARVLYTAVVADMRNKLNGNVFSKNRAGAYVRTKVTPVNRRTTAQQNVRSNFAQGAQGWRQLTEAQRTGWNAFGSAQVAGTDVFGNPSKISGFNWYVRLTKNLLLSGNTANPEPPIVETPSVFSINGGVASRTEAGVALVAISLQGIEENNESDYVIQVTPSYDASRTYITNTFRQIFTIAWESGSKMVNLTVPFASLMGAFNVGEAIAFRVCTVSKISGFRSTWQEYRTIVEAVP